jgi:hypothetical protein
MIRIAAIALIIGLWGAGCSVAQWQRPAGHPADPQAPAGAAAPSVTALDRYRIAVQRGIPDAPAERQAANPNRLEPHRRHGNDHGVAP